MRLKDASLESRGISQGKGPYNLNIPWTSGQIYISLLQPEDQKHYFFFKLSSELRLNITFHLLIIQKFQKYVF